MAGKLGAGLSRKGAVAQQQTAHFRLFECRSFPAIVIARDPDPVAADLHRQYKLATADAIVYATALDNGADLLTCDAHFERLPSVLYFSKAASL